LTPEVPPAFDPHARADIGMGGRPVVTEIVSESTSANVSEAVSSGEAGTLHSRTKSEVEVVLLGA
jgi:hypothetical protein